MTNKQKQDRATFATINRNLKARGQGHTEQPCDCAMYDQAGFTVVVWEHSDGTIEVDWSDLAIDEITGCSTHPDLTSALAELEPTDTERAAIMAWWNNRK